MSKEATNWGNATGEGIPYSVIPLPKTARLGGESPPQTLLLGYKNVRGCSTDQAKRREIDEMNLRRKFDYNVTKVGDFASRPFIPRGVSLSEPNRSSLSLCYNCLMEFGMAMHFLLLI